MPFKITSCARHKMVFCTRHKVTLKYDVASASLVIYAHPNDVTFRGHTNIVDDYTATLK